jgi:hypothetical protein
VDAYNFLTLMQQNTESLGSIFDATPAALVGNIQCLTNPGQQVVGYVSAGAVQQQRLFINGSNVPGWGYAYSCELPNVSIPDLKDSLIVYFGSEGYVPIEQMEQGGPYTANQGLCVDCTLQGGTNQEPSFWPN